MTTYRKSFGIWVPDRKLTDNRGFISPGVLGAVAGARRRSAATAATFTDTFNRTDANPMSTNASGGGTWTSGEGSFRDCKITSNKLEGVGGSASGCRVLTSDSGGSFGANQECYATLGAGGNVAGVGVMVRINSSTDGDGYLFFIDSATSVHFYKITDNGSTISGSSLKAAVTVTTLVAGDIIGIKISGSTLTGWVNGAQVDTVDDSSYSAGHPGLYFSASSNFVDTFTANDF